VRLRSGSPRASFGEEGEEKQIVRGLLAALKIPEASQYLEMAERDAIRQILTANLSNLPVIWRAAR